jgi:hypothetical protein
MNKIYYITLNNAPYVEAPEEQVTLKGGLPRYSLIRFFSKEAEAQLYKEVVDVYACMGIESCVVTGIPAKELTALYRTYKSTLRKAELAPVRFGICSILPDEFPQLTKLLNLD